MNLFLYNADGEGNKGSKKLVGNMQEHEAKPDYYYAFETLPNVWFIRADEIDRVWDVLWEEWWKKKNFQLGFYWRQTALTSFWREKTESLLAERTFDWVQCPLPPIYSQKVMQKEHIKQWKEMWKQYQDIFRNICEKNYEWIRDEKRPFSIFFLCDKHMERSMYVLLGFLISMGIVKQEKIQYQMEGYFPNECDRDYLRKSFYVDENLLKGIHKIKW